MDIGAYPFLLFIFDLCSYGIALIIVVRTFRAYKLPSHLYMVVAFGCFFLSGLSRFTSNLLFSSSTSYTSSDLILQWQLVNTFLVIGWMFIFYGFFRYRSNRFSFGANATSFLGGIILSAFYYPDWITVSYEASTGWTATYETTIGIIMIPFIIIFILSWILPLIIFIRNNPRTTRSSWLQLLSFGLCIIWALLVLFSAIEIIKLGRPFLFALSWLLWSFSVYENPLVLCHSKTEADWLLIIHKTGLPLYYYSISDQMPQNLTLAAGMLSSIDTIFSSLLSDGAKLASVGYKDKQLIFHHKDDFSVLLLSKSVDKVLNIALQHFGDRFERLYHPKLKSSLVESNDYIPTDGLILEIFTPLLDQLNN